MVNYNEIRDLSADELISITHKYLQINEHYDAYIIISYLLEREPENPKVLFTAGKVFLAMDKAAIAEVLFRRAIEFNPLKPEVWGAVGRAIDSYTRFEEAKKYLDRALKIDPNHKPALVNLANALIVNARFEEAIDISKKVTSLDPESVAGHDNLGMAMLAIGQWEGWDHCHYALGGKFRPEVQYKEEGRWDGSKGKSVIIYGEQGLGDEIFYGSCIPDAIKDCKEVIIDCDQRLEGLFKRSFPNAYVYGTRKKAASWPNEHEWDASCAIGTLPMFYRRKNKDFPGTQFLVADPERRIQWRALLDSISDRPKIGIAWNGGGKWTGRSNRSIDVNLLAPLQELGDLVSLEYEHKSHGDLVIHEWSHATHTRDYDDTAALVSELDIVVTVCTTIVHLSGGLGKKCHVLVPDTPSWRYSQEMPWYESVKLHRKKHTWEALISEVVNELKNNLSREAEWKIA